MNVHRLLCSGSETGGSRKRWRYSQSYYENCKGKGCSITLTHLAPFVRDSYNRFYAKYESYGLPKEECERLAKLDLEKEVKDGVQTFNYQINSMTKTNG